MAVLDSLRTRWAAWRSGRWPLIGGATVAVLVLYYGLGGWLAAEIDPDLTVRPTAAQLPPGGSVTAAMAARLIDREVNESSWIPNDSILSRTAILDNKPAYQDGLRQTVAAEVAALGRDPDLQAAATALATPSERGWLHADWPPLGGSAESAYRDAIAALGRYNDRLSGKEIAPDRAPLRLAIQLDALAGRLGGAGGGVERAIASRAAPGDRAADEEFYAVRGSAYAAAMLLRALREDNPDLVRTRQLGLAWNEATDALDRAVAVHPIIVGRADLTEQGYYLLLARNKLKALAVAAGGTP